MSAVHSKISLYLICLWFTFFSTLRDLTFCASIQNSLGLVFFTHQLGYLSEYIFSFLVPQLSTYCWKKNCPSIQNYRIESLWYQISVSLSMAWQSRFFSLGSLSYCPQQLMEMINIYVLSCMLYYSSFLAQVGNTKLIASMNK